MTTYKKQEIAHVIIKILKQRFDSFPEDASAPRNAPFHKAFLEAFSDKFSDAGTNVNSMISMSSWMHGLNTTLGQVFFEKVSHILGNGSKRTFNGDDNKIYANQEVAIANIMTELKNGTKTPNMASEDEMLEDAGDGDLISGANFTVDCFCQDDENVIAIELKSVRPNSGETRGEKQKILKAKAALRRLYPNSKVSYYFGFPFDPTASTETGSCKKTFMNSMIEFSKFCDENEVLLADELWSFLSGEKGTMQALLDLIRSIATVNFLEEFTFLAKPENMLTNTQKYAEIASKWCLEDEVKIANSLDALKQSTERTVKNNLYVCSFDENGQYNERRARTLLSSIDK